MKIETALRHRNQAKSAIDSLYAVAKISGMPSDEMNTAYRAIMADRNHCPRWVHTWCDGYRQALQDALYRHDLVFGGYIDGVFHSTHRSRDDYYEKLAVEPSVFAERGMVKGLGHYWATAATPKPYFIGEE